MVIEYIVMDQSTASLKGAKEDKEQMDRETVEFYKQKNTTLK